MTDLRRKIKAVFLEHYNISRWSNPTAITLTLKKAIPSGLGLVWGAPEYYSQNLRHSLNVIHGKLFGSRGRHKTPRLKVIPILEQDQSGRHHYHLALELRNEMPLEEFRDLIHEVWPNTDWGYKQIDVQPADGGWLLYMTKSRSKGGDLADSIDWDNLHTGSRA
jgi:hypothetical protein